MAKSFNISSTGAVRTILKNKEKFQSDLRDETKEGDSIVRVYDVFYENNYGTFTIVTNDGKVTVAALNFAMGNIINLNKDQNLRKLAEYVLSKNA